MEFWEKVIRIISSLLVAYILACGIQWYLKFRRVKKFCRQYKTLNLFNFFNPENDNHVKQRVKCVNEGMVNFIWPITRIHDLLWVTDVNLVHFLLNLSPDLYKKAGFTAEVFGGDPHGIMGGLLMNNVPNGS